MLKLYSLLLLVGHLLASSPPARDHLCLLAPFISSMHMLEGPPPGTPPGAPGFGNYSIGALLNYDTPIVIKNFLIVPNKATGGYYVDLNKLHIELASDQSVEEVYYTQEKFDPNLPPVSFSKSDYFRILRQHLNLNRGPKAETLVPAMRLVADCSPAYIYEADTVSTFPDTKYAMDRYKKSMTCYKFFSQQPGSSRELGEGLMYTGRLKVESVHQSLSAATDLAPFRFRLTADSSMDLVHLSQDRQRRNITPIINMPYAYLYDKIVLINETMAPNQPGSECRQVLEQARKSLLDSTKDDLMLLYPIRTMTRLSPESYRIQINYNFEENNRGIELRQSSEKGFTVRSHNSNQFLLDEQYDSISVITDPAKPTQKFFVATYIEVITLNNSLTHKSTLSTGKLDANLKIIEGSRKNQALLRKFIAPDDISHWESCKKVVSVYGFLYSIHNYEENILEAPGRWHILDENLFDYPIEAMSIEGDELLVLSKAYTLIVFSIEPNVCDELRLSNKRTLHYRNLFDRNLRLDQLMLESRYYDGAKWTPSLKRESRGTPIHVYIILGCIVALTVVALVVGAIYYWAVKSSQRHVIYSKSNKSRLSGRSSAAAGGAAHKSSGRPSKSSKSAKSATKSVKSARSPKTPKSPMRTAASAMPLFSEFNSDATGAHKSAGSPKSPKRPKARRASPEANSRR